MSKGNFGRQIRAFCGVVLSIATVHNAFSETIVAKGNPLFTDLFTADPAPMVSNDTIYLYTGHDEAKGDEMFTMRDWQCFSTRDLKTWTKHGSIMRATDFKWASQDAWASQAVERGEKFYFYAAVRHDQTHPGMAIGVAVSDQPTGPFVDARGSALITDEMTPGPNAWDDIDPTVFIDDDGAAWLAWGNPHCYLAKLKPNMVEIDGPIAKIPLPNYTEGPWLHKHGNLYYLTYAAFAHQEMWEKICYATAPKITGPWTYRGILTGSAQNSYTIHPGIIEYHGQSYFFYHNATLTIDGDKGGLGRRAVCVEYLYYNPDGTLQPIEQTIEGVSVPPKPIAHNTPAKTPRIPASESSVGLRIYQSQEPYLRKWPGAPLFSTAVDPFASSPYGLSFNHAKGVTSLGQTFSVAIDTELTRIALYAGDGLGADLKNPVRLALYDLGTDVASPPDHYIAKDNLLGRGEGLSVAYTPQAPGLLTIELTAPERVALKAGHAYILELQGISQSAPLFWRKTSKDMLQKGAAYLDRTRFEGKEAPGDFVMAIYGSAKK